MSELHEAAFAGSLELVEVCLERGLNPSEPDPEWKGRTAVHVASSQGHKKCVYLLLSSGANVNAVTDSGWTAAHFACETGQAQCLSTLLSFDLDLGIQDYAGDTAEQVAEIYNHKECLEVIREHLKKAKFKSPGHSPSARRSSANSTEVKSDASTVAATIAATHRTRGSSPVGSRKSSTYTKGNSSNSSNDDLRTVIFAHPDVQLPTDTAS